MRVDFLCKQIIHSYVFRGLYPFEEYISYTNNSFTLEEVKHLWRKNRCAKNYGKALKIRVDNFESPTETNVLCSDWTSWKQPIIWYLFAILFCYHNFAISASILMQNCKMAELIAKHVPILEKNQKAGPFFVRAFCQIYHYAFPNFEKFYWVF